jgi:dolichyl-phosphate-mannose--protein O-mannosyl transferase
MVGLLLFSLALRFWGLGRFNTLVFDEVYYAKFAANYLNWTPFFDGHPPLSKYLIAFGMWVGQRSPFGQDVINGLSGVAVPAWSYRWVNALLGSLIPLVVAGIAWQLTRSYRYTGLAALFVGLDGLLLVESRYALNNVHLILLGLLGLWALLESVMQGSARSSWLLLLAGVCFGASASIKWNGLWFLMGAYGLWAIAWLQASWPQADSTTAKPLQLETLEASSSKLAPNTLWQSPVQRLSRLNPWQIGVNLAVIPFITYALLWIPHLQLNRKAGVWADFWELQGQIFRYHRQVGDGKDIHPYCSGWLSWLVMQRPVAYFYQVTGKNSPLPTGNSTAPVQGEQVIYDVHAIGNPMLWWFSTVAIVIILGLLVWLLVHWLMAMKPSKTQRLPLFNPTSAGVITFLGINYLANLLPWIPVTRCKFLYHYMGSALFAAMGLAWLVDRALRSRQPWLRQLGIAVILFVGLAFLFWLPIYLGLPLSPNEFRSRMWFKSWV